TRLFSDVPAVLRQSAEHRWREFLDAGGRDPDDVALRASAARVWAASEFVSRIAKRYPDLIGKLIDSGYLTRRTRPDEISACITNAVADATDETDLMSELRRCRNIELIRIAWRDMAGWAELEESLQDLSDLADACITGALQKLTVWHEQRFGKVRNAAGKEQRFIVIALGKLGAHELNFSSDVDLLFAYPEAGESDGARVLAGDEYFARLGQRLIHVLSHMTEDGFVYRVDMRLRPFGDSGPLVMNFTAFEAYYQQQGREWERYALIKARPVAGDIDSGNAFLKLLRPFVYRRYLDFGVFESLREMKQGIETEVKRRGMENNIKTGPGGIREIEFIGQVYQLLRGGRDPELQERAILRVLELLAAKRMMPERDAIDISEAYRFLRLTENRLQAIDDQQLHELPTQEHGRAQLALAMGFPDWAAFTDILATHRATIRDKFERVLVGPQTSIGGREDHSELNAIWSGDAVNEEAQTYLAKAGYKDTDGVLKKIEAFRSGAQYRALGERGRKLLRKLMPEVIVKAARGDSAETTLDRLLKIIETIASRTTYLSLLIENPQALEQLAKVCRASRLISEMVARYPLLLDELIDPRILEAPAELSALEEEVRVTLQHAPVDDVELRTDALREAQQVAVMRIAMADIGGKLPIMKVSDYLTRVAELVIEDVLRISYLQLGDKHGLPKNCGADIEAMQFCVVGYGKLGGLELGYGSDLDLVFLHDGTPGQTEGKKPIDNALFFLRLVQRIINLLSTQTNAGALYQVDTRLRPSGSAGLLVTSLDAFQRYQSDDAWVWEHQALLRARPVAGDPSLGERFLSIRRDVLCASRDADQLGTAIQEMRERMYAERPRDIAGFDLKSEYGGITDIEFLVQY
ncbi:MAG: bifunctional [glutamate--ammonia ligase]-adenylyl-L-tyrosine phosphorylase/[glutamate--ammonia-ligase] adenylyltransferase, partial [Gammaproteobacteria bacterium]|nr:bifunctional [glutamate--ammonia ligase]-adenylyl-L-tyrosine phosphorylase/[glutamate--ammonia-ligase] adenylyltransferase [Gammaproteobacteria bacterium]